MYVYMNVCLYVCLFVCSYVCVHVSRHYHTYVYLVCMYECIMYIQYCTNICLWTPTHTDATINHCWNVIELLSHPLLLLCKNFHYALHINLTYFNPNSFLFYIYITNLNLNVYVNECMYILCMSINLCTHIHTYKNLKYLPLYSICG